MTASSAKKNVSHGSGNSERRRKKRDASASSVSSRSVKSVLTDPLKAGTDLGLQLADMAPEVVFLFCSTHYSDPGELAYGLGASLGKQVPVIGCSGDGFYGNDGVEEIGASALGLRFNKGATTRLVCVSGLSEDPEGVTRTMLTSLQAGAEPKLIIMLSDFRVDPNAVERVLEDNARVPIVGGLAGDDFRMEKCFLFYNNGCVQDSIVALGLYGDIDFDIYMGNDVLPVGDVGEVTGSHDKQVEKINNLYAIDFIEKQTGEPALPTDRGVTSFMVLDPDNSHLRRLRSIQNPYAFKRPMNLYAGIPQGTKVQVCVPDADRLMTEVVAITDRAADSDNPPNSALVFSGSGRKYCLGNKINGEVRALQDRFGEDFHVAGLPTFGEFAPICLPDGTYSESVFYNMTYVLTVFR